MSLLLLLACTPGGGKDWTAPDFDGDGLPSSVDTNHDDPRRDADTSGARGDTGDTAESSFPDYDLVDGVFAYQDYYGYLFGYVILTTETETCHDALTTSLDAVMYYLLPAAGDDGEPAWVADYPACGDYPCTYYGFWTQGADYGYVSGDMSIDAYSEHYVTVSFSNEIDADTLSFYNCGDASNWAY